MDTFKKRLAKAMRRMNITQAELCAMTGISRSTMSQYYSGAFRPKEDKLRRIAKALEVNEAWLLGYENPNSTAELVEKFPNIRPETVSYSGRDCLRKADLRRRRARQLSDGKRRDPRRLLPARPRGQHDRRKNL